MKRSVLLILILLPFIAGCGASNNSSSNEDLISNEVIDYKSGENVETRNYMDIKADEIHPDVDDGYFRISSVLIDSEFFVDAAEDITYLYKLSCKDSEDSFQTHRFICDDDGFYYAEISEEQHDMIPNGFDILKNSNYSGSSVEISINEIYQCFTYTELYYSEIEQKIKVVDFDHVIPGLEESKVNSLLGKSVDYYVYVDETGIKSLNYGNLPFTSELIIKYIDVSGSEIQIREM